MPSLVRSNPSCGYIYDYKPHHVRGIPLKFFVRPIARQNGVFVDMPKGFELPTCMVDPCCAQEPPPEEPINP